MSISRYTSKEIIIRNFQEMMQQKSLDRITVSEICEKCQINRQMFYYYFTDKYDLANRSFEYSANAFYGPNSRKTSWYDTTLRMLEYMKEHTAYFINVYNNSYDDSFSKFMVEYSMRSKLLTIQEASDSELSQDDLFQLKIHSYGVVWLVKEWVLKGMKEPSEYIARMATITIPEHLQKYFLNTSKDDTSGLL